MVYVCARKECQKEITQDNLNQLPGIKCPYCGQSNSLQKKTTNH